MRRTQSSSNFVPIEDPDFEITLEQLRRARRPRTGIRQEENQEVPTMNPQNPGQRRTLADYVMPAVQGNLGAIVMPQIAEGDFEIKPSTVSMVQHNTFHGRMGENPYSHLANFDNVCETFRIARANEDQIKLRLFPFSLCDEAQTWLRSLPPGSITTWAQLKQPFLHKYFPPHKTVKLRNAITSFKQKSGESLYTS